MHDRRQATDSYLLGQVNPRRAGGITSRVLFFFKTPLPFLLAQIGSGHSLTLFRTRGVALGR